MFTLVFENWILVVGILSYTFSPNDATENFETCKTNECTKISRFFMRTIDSDVQPCDDFYAYACGKIIKQTEIPEGWDAVNSVHSVISIMKLQLLQSLKTKNPNDPDVVKRAKSFFASCNSEAEIDNLGVVPLNILLKNLGFPLRPPYLGALDMKDDFGTIIGKMRQYFNVNFPFRLEVGLDPADKNKSRLELLLPTTQENSKLPYRPPSTQQSEQQTEPKKNESTNKSTALVENDNIKEKKSAPPVRNFSRKVSKRRSFALDTRALRDTPKSPVKSKVVKKKVGTSPPNLKDNEEDENKKKNIKKTPTNKTLPKKTEGKETKKNEETKIVEDKNKDDDQSEDEKNQTEPGKNNEPSPTLEITENENQPLIQYMIKVANYLYKQTNVKLLEGKSNSLYEKVAEVAKILHEIEKVKNSTNFRLSFGRKSKHWNNVGEFRE